MCQSHFLGKHIRHGVRCSSTRNLNGFAALIAGIQHLFGRMQIAFKIGFQIVQHTDDRKKRMHFTVIIRFAAPVAFYALGQRIKCTGFFMIQRQ